MVFMAAKISRLVKTASINDNLIVDETSPYCLPTYAVVVIRVICDVNRSIVGIAVSCMDHVCNRVLGAFGHISPKNTQYNEKLPFMAAWQ